MVASVVNPSPNVFRRIPSIEAVYKLMVENDLGTRKSDKLQIYLYTAPMDGDFPN